MEGLQEDYLPQHLYRVQYPGCQTNYSEKDGLLAGDLITVPRSDDQVAFWVKESFTWGSRNVSPYINLFSEHDHAVNWAISESHRTGERYLVLSIDTSLLERPCVIKLSTAMRRLNIKIPEAAVSHVKSGYLCLHNIPAPCISKVQASDELSRERTERNWRREEFVDHSKERPGTHWSYELHGYYSTDEEVEECNMNGNIERMLDEL